MCKGTREWCMKRTEALCVKRGDEIESRKGTEIKKSSRFSFCCAHCCSLLGNRFAFATSILQGIHVFQCVRRSAERKQSKQRAQEEWPVYDVYHYGWRDIDSDWDAVEVKVWTFSFSFSFLF